ncbi:MAG: hypothetical protein V3V63_00140 [Candidatus Hydrothermarchaeaceae archaeon]
MRALVLDTSAFVTGFGPGYGTDSSLDTFTVKEVINEIKNRELKLRVDLYLNDGLLKLVEPSERALMFAKQISGKSGDLATLSDTDLKVIALAHDLREDGLEVTIMTDDYAIQNISNIAGIKYTPAAEMGIQKVIRWKNICSACKKTFPPDFKGKCTDCGSELRIVRTTTTSPVKEP